MTRAGIRKHAAIVLLVLYAGTAMPASMCLIDCVISAAATEIGAARNHCNAEPSLGSGDDACHATAEAAHVPLRSEYLSAGSGGPAFVELAFTAVTRCARQIGGCADESASAHGPPATHFPLRV